ncbi:MAG: rhomboid family intramembrane serine protease [Corynebacterium sp.]|uniref:rhomboid family intramembrane serine protease n=1 Tax=Corynebacterium sp. TaxID=1720 RepID=UPI0026DC8625|nr:rhomboid family intramembrane serine protease [Corynebacterium sp.]MDO5099232.1 rhomboid family intramembrane serine protease [Corynebacterium sp.]
MTQPTRGGITTALSFAIGYTLIIWAVHIINASVFSNHLAYFGIRPLDPATLWHIVTSPLIHGSFNHLIANTVPGAVFSFLIGWSGARVYWEVTLITMAIGGIGVWFTGGVGTTHIGASGLIYGWLAYLIIRGIFNRSLNQVLLGFVLAVAYSGLVWGVLPGEPGVSWQAHLFGAIGGMVAGAFITSDDPPALQAKRAAAGRR